MPPQYRVWQQGIRPLPFGDSSQSIPTTDAACHGHRAQQGMPAGREFRHIPHNKGDAARHGHRAQQGMPAEPRTVR
jgi:hypothetical protein